MTSDRHVRRSGSDYAEALGALLPQGAAWPRDKETVLQRLVSGLAQVWGDWVDRRAADLLENETDPTRTFEMLPDWERNWGLPDPCIGTALTIDERRRLLLLKMTLLGGQSRAFFYEMCARLNKSIHIKEHSPFMCGISRCGDTTAEDDTGDMRWEIGPPEIRYFWSAHPGQPDLIWFRAGSGEAGVDHHLEFGLATDLDCLLQRWKPAHTELVLDWSSLETGGPMQGTP